MKPKKTFSFYVLTGLFISFFSLPSAQAMQNPDVRITISVDWEGTNLDDYNLQTMRNFRQKYPEVRLVHFLNAAYFTKPGVNAGTVRRKIQSVLLPGDELGLHLHGWQSLFEASGVTYLSGPTYEGDEVSRDAAFEDGIIDRGHDVPISAYSTEDLRKVVRKSLRILNENSFDNIRSFRAGGWLGTPKVLAAIAGEGINIDSSPLPDDLVTDAPIPQPLWGMAIEANRGARVSSEPSELSTVFGVVKVFPDSAGMADYVSPEAIVQMFQASFAEMEQNNRAGMHFHMGFHQETAALCLYKIRIALEQIESFLKGRNIKMRNTTLVENAAQPF